MNAKLTIAALSVLLAGGAGLVASAAGTTSAGSAAEGATAAKAPAAKAPPAKAGLVKRKKGVPAVLNFKMNNLAGKETDLAKYAGRVVLIVNTASRCGYTPQYEGLEELHQKYNKQGLSVLGFPANDFGAQEPGTDAEIATFCKKNYGVTFDMFSKVSVKGPGKCPLYQHLTSETTNPASPGEVAWNFEKFLIGRDGRIAARFLSGVAPMSDELTKAVEAELAKKK